MSEQDELDRRRLVIRVAAAAAVAALLVLAGLMLSGARAADLPCPPKHTACWQVRLAVDSFGETATVERAKACGWSEAKIAQARKCLRPQRDPESSRDDGW
jgi:hypothetical protein